LVVVDDVEEAKAVVADLFKTLAELTLLPCSSVDSRGTKRHIEEEGCFKCNKNRDRLFQCLEPKVKEAMGTPSKKQ
jgi:hypothetical protein